MNHNDRFVHSAMRACRLDRDSLPGRSLIEICEQRRVLIEHHLGIINYGYCEITVRVSFGSVAISGENLKLRLLSKEKMVISGSISGVKLCKGK